MDDNDARAFNDVMNRFARDWNAFNDAIIGFPIPTEPTILNFERGEFRLGFLREELKEFELALSDEKLDECVDALIDLIYVAMGALGEMGVLVQPTWNEVQQANMKKLRGSLSKRAGQGYDAVKPEGWVAPSHTKYLTVTARDIQYILDAKAMVAEALDKGSNTVPQTVPVHMIGDKPKNKPKVLVLGYARHGKDTVCELLAKRYGLRFTSSSLFCAEKVMFPYFQERHPGLFDTVEECYNARSSYRDTWYREIAAYNQGDLARLAREILVDHDIYCGLRNIDEFRACKDLFDVVVWVDGGGRGLPPEDFSSCTVHPTCADILIENGSTIANLVNEVDAMMSLMGVEMVP